MSWQEIIRQLHALHKTIRCADLMDNVGAYAEEAVRLDARLFKAIGKKYIDLTPKLIATCLLA